MKKTLIFLIIISITFIVLPNLSLAGFEGCGCYCGKILRPPCGDEDCKRACGWKGPSSAPSQTGPSYDYEAERQRQEAERERQLENERQRQREIEEQRQREEEEAKARQAEFERNKQEALKRMKSITEDELGLKGTDAGGLGLKDIGNTGTGDLGLKSIENNKAVPINSNKEFKAKIKKVHKAWQKALGCAMEEVYARAESLGPDGISFAQDLRSEMTRVFDEAGEKVKDSDDVNIVDLKLDRQVSAGNGNAERQFIVEVAVHSKDKGNIDVDVQSYFSKSAGKKDKQENLQSFLVLNKSGKVIKGQKSAAVSACLAR